MNRFLKAGRNTAIGLLVFILILSGFLRVIRYPNLVAVVKLGTAKASSTPTLMPWNTIEPATTPIPLSSAPEKMPATVRFGSESISWQNFLTQTNTNAFLVIRNGVLTYEYYKPGVTPATRLPSYSVAKTMTSIIIGQLIADGKIKESDKFIDFFPKWKTGTSFDQITIQSLLDMEAGVGVSDNYPSGPTGWGVGIAQMYATTDLNFFISHNRKMFEAPNTKAEYRSVETQLLGLIIHNVTGMSLSEYFQKNIWQPIGTEFAATWNIDHKGGQEKNFCCFNAAARDYARVGLLLVNNGYAGSRQIISKEWMKRLSTPVVTLDHNWKYSAQVWHPYPGINLALGLDGQYIFTDPATHTVIVKLSDNSTNGDPEVETAAVMYALDKR